MTVNCDKVQNHAETLRDCFGLCFSRALQNAFSIELTIRDALRYRSPDPEYRMNRRKTAAFMQIIQLTIKKH